MAHQGRAPAFQFYTGDWRKDAEVQSLDHEHKGVWIDLIVIMWDTAERGRLVLRDGSPMPDLAIARNLGIPEADWKQKRSTLLASGTASEDESGVFYCRRMTRDEVARGQKVEAGRKSGLVKRSESTQASEPISGTRVYRAEDEDEEVVVVEESVAVVVNKTKDGGLVAERIGQVLDHSEKQQSRAQVRFEFAKIVFSYWAARCHRYPRKVKWDVKRERKLKDRLRENDNDVGELLCVVDGAIKDPYLNGENESQRKYLGISTIFRDREQVERLAALSPHYGKNIHPFMVP